ncbi:MAG: hypothetical protein R3296_07500 [Oleiphilaceae bacterium]|nr:hypothetical protein [Oleiphilaceae bacterium]
MSLLNEALRDLDQRQPREDGSHPVPPGLQDKGHGSAWLIMGLCAALLLVSLLALWLWWQDSATEVPGLAETVPTAQDVPTVSKEAPTANSEVTTATESSPTTAAKEQPPTTATAPPAPSTDPSVAPIAEPIPTHSEAQTASAADGDREASVDEASAPAANNRAVTDKDTESRPEPARQLAATDSAAQSPDSGSAVSDRAGSRQQEPDHGADSTNREDGTAEADRPSVRQLSPQQREAMVAREIRERLAGGDVSGATDQARQRVLLDTDAPETRAVMARHWLSREDPARARDWLPDGVSQRYPQLRLLRARSELQSGRPQQALEWLERELPPVASHSRYHVTMAALQQQLGWHEAAAGTWAALIEQDDSQARWWAGLGIALEGQGRHDSARRAFVQASELPGLNEPLQRYVQSRLGNAPTHSGNR